jgi:hypothetical protein
MNLTRNKPWRQSSDSYCQLSDILRAQQANVALVPELMARHDSFRRVSDANV